MHVRISKSKQRVFFLVMKLPFGGMKICQPNGRRLFLSHAPKAEILECRLFWVVCPWRVNCGSAVPLQSQEQLQDTSFLQYH